MAVQVNVMGHIEFDGASVEQVVHVWYEKVALLSIFDDHVDLEESKSLRVHLLAQDEEEE